MHSETMNLPGEITIDLLDQDGIPANVITWGKKSSAKVTLKLDADPTTFPLWIAPNLRLKTTLYIESMGQGPSYQLPAVEKPLEGGVETYTFVFPLPQTELGIGAYGLAASIEVLGDSGVTLPIVGYAEGRIFQIYSSV